MHLLLIEDDLDLGTALQRALMGHGYACTWVRSVKDARLQVQAFDQFACLVLDLGLPDGEGLELLRAWRRDGVVVPVIVLTARDAVASKVSGLAGLPHPGRHPACGGAVLFSMVIRHDAYSHRSARGQPE